MKVRSSRATCLLSTNPEYWANPTLCMCTKMCQLFPPLYIMPATVVYSQTYFTASTHYFPLYIYFIPSKSGELNHEIQCTSRNTVAGEVDGLTTLFQSTCSCHIRVPWWLLGVCMTLSSLWAPNTWIWEGPCQIWWAASLKSTRFDSLFTAPQLLISFVTVWIWILKSCSAMKLQNLMKKKRFILSSAFIVRT